VDTFAAFVVNENEVVHGRVVLGDTEYILDGVWWTFYSADSNAFPKRITKPNRIVHHQIIPFTSDR